MGSVLSLERCPLIVHGWPCNYMWQRGCGCLVWGIGGPLHVLRSTLLSSQSSRAGSTNPVGEMNKVPEPSIVFGNRVLLCRKNRNLVDRGHWAIRQIFNSGSLHGNSAMVRTHTCWFSGPCAHISDMVLLSRGKGGTLGVLAPQISCLI